MEQFSIPGVGGIIEREIDGIKSIHYKWTPVIDVKRIVEDSSHTLYPMHVDTLKKYVYSTERLLAK